MQVLGGWRFLISEVPLCVASPARLAARLQRIAASPKSMSLKYEPSSEPLHISVKQLNCTQVTPEDVASPARLAQRLQRIAASPALLARHHAWRYFLIQGSGCIYKAHRRVYIRLIDYI